MKKLISLVFVLVLFYKSNYSQSQNWHHLDLESDHVFGASVDKAYARLLTGKQSKKVIVAIVDTGIDTLHEDLRPVLWKRSDGVRGWNYIGAETGREDVTCIVADKKDFYDSLSYTIVPDSYRSEYQVYKSIAPQLSAKREAMNAFIANLERSREIINAIRDPSNYEPTNGEQKILLQRIKERLPFYSNWNEMKRAEIDDLIDKAEYHLMHGLNIKNKENDTANGDANIQQDAVGLFLEPNLTPYHGSHVAGIIGAARNNGKGINGVADNVELQMLKANGNIRELRDRSLAKAIRFAVDNGAKIINLSFGKPYTWDKRSVDEAVKYAMEKDVLIVHAAGNNGQNLDEADHYPNPEYADQSGSAAAWLEVGASGWKDDSALVPKFSNYGKKTVDLFAPGVNIYSSISYNQYEAFNGTSMAAPVVTGIAALIREYYPKLTAVQVKEIIMKSVIKRPVLADKCISGGVVNAYNALKLAATYK